MKKTVILCLLIFFISAVYPQETVTDVKPKETEKPEVENKHEEGITEPEKPKPPVEQPKPVKPEPAESEEDQLLAKVESNTKNSGVYNRLLKIYASQGKHKERLKVALKAIQNIGGSANLYLIVGDENKSLGDYPKALISYQFALRILPSDPNIYNRIGLALLKISSFNQAESSFKAAVFFASKESVNTKGIFYNNLAVSYEAMHDLKSAYKYFQTALKFYPGYGTAKENLVRVRSNLKNSGINVE